MNEERIAEGSSWSCETDLDQLWLGTHACTCGPVWSFCNQSNDESSAHMPPEGFIGGEDGGSLNP
ncbi:MULTISPECIES: hypothetical protein [Bradyrhizobium]|uniref:Uncharacterized protein n=1 Tax=Bradyrhizobium yuanmingense TaxID=108015 RepID=A0A1C3XG28_9BRAD|nr:MULTISPECIES: hypothetical protein [Bradyrhizobium]MCA1544341.1 hypothetical protein [Bradyrhizobium sp. NBAIM32]RQH03580.1 hypothetical protein EHH60_35355 [Bradyrhizobium sp. RP6]TWI18757.1 hypothetical protein IQ15_07064 [Bradyrhizobium yuanmingense]UWU93567.1 hypothetical protein N2604_06425 [Bradyrhizobium sp. CB1015]SCB51221.1 hypothetical protein GA0061099_10168 [Bradyrhizobium yuanmingense]